MTIPPGGLSRPFGPGTARPGVQAAPAKKAASSPGQGAKAAPVREKMLQQGEKHLAFLLRARSSLAFYTDKTNELNSFIADHADWTDADTKEQVAAAKDMLLEIADSVEELQQSIGNEQEEHTFIMSTLEALLSEDGKFPVHTLEAYLERKQAPRDEPPRYKTYSLDDLDKLIAGQRAALGKADSIGEA